MAEEIVTIFKADSKQYEESLKTQIALVTQKATVEAETANKEKANLTEAETAAKKRVTFIKEEIQDLDELKKRRALASNPKDIEEYNKRISETEKRIKTVKGVTEEAAEATNRFGKIGQDAFGLLDKLTFGLAGKMKNLIVSVAGVTKGMNFLKTALISSGIGAIVVAIGTLVAYFTQTQKGADLLSRAMKGLGAAMGPIIKLAADIGEDLIKAFENPEEAIIKLGESIQQFLLNRIEDFLSGIKGLGDSLSLLFEGEYKEAAKAAGKAFIDLTTSLNPLAGVIKDNEEELRKLGGAMADAGYEADQIELAYQRLRDAEIELNIERAKSRASIKELNLLGEDTTKSVEERTEAITKAITIEQGLLKKQKEGALERIELIKRENALRTDPTDLHAREALAEAEIALAAIVEQSLELQTTLNNRLNKLNEKAAADKLASTKALLELNARLIEEAANNEIVELDILLAQKKIDQEQYAKESVAIEAIRLEQIARLYGEDSDEYKQALLDKLAAEQAYSDETDAIFKEFFDEGDRIENIRLNKRDETRKKQAKLDEDAAELKKQQDEDAFDSGLELAGELGSILEEGSANRIAAIEQESEARQQAGDQELNRLYSELAVAQGADQARILSAIQVQRDLLKIQTEADAESLQKEKQRAKNFKRIQLVTTTIQEAVAIGRGLQNWVQLEDQLRLLR
jgi:tetrahydromethanopterin S-methyltransferase subunit G